MTTHNLDRRARSAQLIPMVSIAAIATLAIVVAVGAYAGWQRGGNGGTVVPPTASPSPTALAETPAPTPVPTRVPTPAPPDGGSNAMPIKVDLVNATGADVYVDIVDRTRLLVKADSGTPGDGMSVEPYSIKVENVDPVTLKLTWVDYPIDNALALFIDESDGAIRLLLVQPAPTGPTGPTDSIGFDRELILSLSQPIAADQVESVLQEGLDTPGWRLPGPWRAALVDYVPEPSAIWAEDQVTSRASGCSSNRA